MATFIVIPNSLLSYCVRTQPIRWKDAIPPPGRPSCHTADSPRGWCAWHRPLSGVQDEVQGEAQEGAETGRDDKPREGAAQAGGFPGKRDRGILPRPREQTAPRRKQAAIFKK